MTGTPHTVTYQKGYYDKKGNLVRTQNTGTDTCTCNSGQDHTQVKETETIE